MSLAVFRREVTIATRRGRLQTGRAWFAGILLVIVLGTFASWYFAAGGRMSREMMSQVAERSYLFVGIAYATLLLGLATVSAVSIAGEMDRKTLGFVLTTRLRSAEIVMGKLAALLAGFVMDLGIGLPIMILLSVLGGVPPELVLIAYAGISSTAVIVLAIGIFVSAGAANGRRAANVTILSIMLWLILPVFVGHTSILSSIGLRPPQFVMNVNAWLLASNPMTLLPMFLIGGVRPAALYHNVGWMCGLQLGAAPVLILGAIARLRPAYRANAGGDGGAIARRLGRPAWRFRPRPPVADDPILWREMYTNRGGLIGQVIGQCISLAVVAALASGTFFFGRRAFVELWQHGYTAVAATAEKPEMNLVLRYFLDETGANKTVDAHRVDFNVFLRFTTLSIMFMISLVAAGIAVELISTEKAKDTWNSLITTSLSAREILLGKFKAALWRLRGLAIVMFVLWTLGLLSGAIHPLGYLAAMLTLASSTALYVLFGLMAATRAAARSSASAGVGMLVLPIQSAILPFLLPAGLNSVLWGVGSTPLVTWLSMVSYREVRGMFQQAAYPALTWIKLETAGSPAMGVLTCLIGIIGPALGAWWIWSHSVRNFDRWVGRPCREEAVVVAEERIAALPATVA
jgi:ABC-type transport system involved in multi-copper enzyme maturation permease subunit